jgi:DNA invertase Pin-like site-specific DNA recombinase
VETFEELDVSGAAALERRPGLSRAVALIEEGRADVIVVAYFDRLVRSLRVQGEVVERVEKAGGEIHAVDVGKLTNGTATERLSSAMLGAVNEYVGRATVERSREGVVEAIAHGVAPFPNLPPGYRRDGKRTEIDRKTASLVIEVFRLRSEGATLMAVRDYLGNHGIRRSFHGVSAMLSNRFYLGELHFGVLVNLESHPALIDPATFNRVQRISVPRGPRPRSERLLARLGVLRCGTCDARMVIGSTRQQGKPYAFYRCDPLHDCPRRVTISATVAEQFLEDEVRALLAGMRGKASSHSDAKDAARKLEQAQAELDAAIGAFKGAGVQGEAASVERLSALRQARDEAQERLEELQSTDISAFVVDANADWSLLTLEERRALIRAVVARASVAPGRGTDRITVEARS